MLGCKVNFVITLHLQLHSRNVFVCVVLSVNRTKGDFSIMCTAKPEANNYLSMIAQFLSNSVVNSSNNFRKKSPLPGACLGFQVR